MNGKSTLHELNLNAIGCTQLHSLNGLSLHAEPTITCKSTGDTSFNYSEAHNHAEAYICEAELQPEPTQHHGIWNFCQSTSTACAQVLQHLMVSSSMEICSAC